LRLGPELGEAGVPQTLEGDPMLKRFPLALAVLALIAFGVAACGDDESTSTSTAATPETSTTTDAGASSGGGSTVDISADPDGALAFTKSELTTTAGSDTIVFDNPSTTSHNVEIEDADGNDVAETDTISGDTAETTADLEPGTYTFYCAVDGHREAGMEGTLTVK
jgi:plastocyanin